MSETPTESTEFEVNLSRPGPRRALIVVALVVLVLGTIGIAAAMIANRAATPAGNPTAQVMPANTLAFFSLNTHAEQLPNYNVVANAWKDSKEAKQLASALQLGLTQVGLNWQEDIQPWLGDRAGVGVVDLGGVNSGAGVSNTLPGYRAPFFVVAAQTSDRAKSDAFLAALGQQLSKSGTHQTVENDTYRGIPLAYLRSASSDAADSSAAWATVNDVVVITIRPDNLKKVIDAALDGSNLAANANYQATLSALPDQNVAAFYLDYNHYIDALMSMSQAMQGKFNSSSANLDPKQAEALATKRTEMLQLRDAQMAQLRQITQAMGGMGAVMTYEPGGIRFDVVSQFDPARLPEAQRKQYEAALTPTSGHIFNSIPSSAIVAANANNFANVLKPFFDPSMPNPFGALPGTNSGDIASQLAEFQKLIGIDLNADLVNLLDGEYGVVVLPKPASGDTVQPGSHLPFDIVLMLEASDAQKAKASLDKVLQGVSALSKDGMKWQSLSGLPYCAVLNGNGEVMFAYGVIDGRLVIGTSSNALLAIANANQSPLSADTNFKAATDVLPADRLQTGYIQLQPLWAMVSSSSHLGNDCPPCNYLRPIKWISFASEAPANGLMRGSLHIGISK